MKKRSNSSHRTTTDIVGDYVNNLINEIATVRMYKEKRMLISYASGHWIAKGGNATKQMAPPMDDHSIFTVQIFNKTTSKNEEINLIVHMGWWIPNRQSFVYDDRTNKNSPQIDGNIFSRDAQTRLYIPITEAMERAGFSFKVTPTREWKSLHISNAIMEFTLTCPCFSLVEGKRRCVMSDMDDCEPIDPENNFIVDWTEENDKKRVTENTIKNKNIK